MSTQSGDPDKAKRQADASRQQNSTRYPVQDQQRNPTSPDTTPKNPRHRPKGKINQSFDSQKYAAYKQVGSKPLTSADKTAYHARENAKPGANRVQVIQEQQRPPVASQSRLDAVKAKVAAGMEKMRETGRKGSASVAQLMERRAASANSKVQEQTRTPQRTQTPERSRDR